MTREELILRRLHGQHLLIPVDTQTVVKDLCGVQAQFLSYALHGLKIRCELHDTDGLVKSWTNRGTMHLFSVDDLPLFLHEGRSHFLRPVDTLQSDVFASANRKAYFADLILDAVSRGVDGREALKSVCEKAGMSDNESKSLFDPWGGLIRALCEAGRLCHKVQEKKAYQLCPKFEPMDKTSARLELARRYFTHFGPATVKDAAYFFGTTQTQVKKWLENLPIIETKVEGKSCFYIDNGAPDGKIPGCLFLAGFDQLMLGYDKTESLFLPSNHIRDIFTLSGIVRPAILVDGVAVGFWNVKNRILTINLWDKACKNIVEDTAERSLSEIRGIRYGNVFD